MGASKCRFMSGVYVRLFIIFRLVFSRSADFFCHKYAAALMPGDCGEFPVHHTPQGCKTGHCGTVVAASTLRLVISKCVRLVNCGSVGGNTLRHTRYCAAVRIRNTEAGG